MIGEVESLGGTVTSISGAGLAAVFGAPEAHEDDPERAVRAGYRMLSAAITGGNAGGAERLSLRVGVETGPAVFGPLWSGATAGYAAMGEVVEAAAALQSAAKVGSVLVGRPRRLLLKAFSTGAQQRRSHPTPGPNLWTRFTWSGQSRAGLAPAASVGLGVTPAWSAGRWRCWPSTKRCGWP